MDLDTYPQHGRDSGMERVHRFEEGPDFSLEHIMGSVLLTRACCCRGSGLGDRPQLRTDCGPRQLFNYG